MVTATTTPENPRHRTVRHRVCLPWPWQWRGPSLVALVAVAEVDSDPPPVLGDDEDLHRGRVPVEISRDGVDDDATCHGGAPTRGSARDGKEGHGPPGIHDEHSLLHKSRSRSRCGYGYGYGYHEGCGLNRGHLLRPVGVEGFPIHHGQNVDPTDSRGHHHRRRRRHISFISFFIPRLWDEDGRRGEDARLRFAGALRSVEYHGPTWASRAHVPHDKSRIHNCRGRCRRCRCRRRRDILARGPGHRQDQ